MYQWKGENAVFLYQLSFLDQLELFEMYDGYETKDTLKILTDCGIQKLTKGKIAYFITKDNNNYQIAFPNEYGGSYGFTVREKQFKEYFKYLGKKIYPKSKEIWDGKSWIINPDFK